MHSLQSKYLPNPPASITVDRSSSTGAAKVKNAFTGMAKMPAREAAT